MVTDISHGVPDKGTDVVQGPRKRQSSWPSPRAGTRAQNQLPLPPGHIIPPSNLLCSTGYGCPTRLGSSYIPKHCLKSMHLRPTVEFPGQKVQWPDLVSCPNWFNQPWERICGDRSYSETSSGSPLHLAVGWHSVPIGGKCELEKHPQIHLLCPRDLRSLEGKRSGDSEEDKTTHCCRVFGTFLPSRIKDFQTCGRES